MALLASGMLLIGCASEDEPPTAADDTEQPDDAEDPGETGETDETETETAPDAEGTEAEGETVSITVGDIAGTPSAFLQFAVDQGFFEEQNLDVTVDVSPGGAANVPGVLGGEYEIAGSNIVSMVLARGEGLPLRMISAGTFATEDPEDDFSVVLVPADSDIEGPEDLDGRSVAVNTLANIAEVAVRAALENQGASHENVDFVEMPFPDMVPAVQEGRVDAVHVIEPFMSIGLDQGLRSVLVPYAQTEPGIAIGSYFSSDEYIEQNSDVVDRFIEGVSAAGDYVAENQDEFREQLPELAGLDPEVAEMVNIPNWGGPVDVASVERLTQYMVDFGIISEAPPVEEVVYSR